MPDVWDVSHGGITVTTAVTIMLLAIVTVAAVAWHGTVAGTNESALVLMSAFGTKRTSRGSVLLSALGEGS